MTEAEVIDRINSTIKKNGNRTITGDEMNFILKAIIELIADAGGSKPLNSVLADGNETLEYDIILTELDRIVVGANRAGLSKGTFNTGRGGDKGVSLQCAVEFELNWQAGYLRVITPGGDGTPLLLQTDSEIVYTELVPTTPTYGRSLVDKNYADTKFPNPTGTTAEYIRGDGSIEAFPTIPDVTGLQSKAVVVSINQTAVNDGSYTVVSNATFTDPSPVEGKGYRVFVRNGTATINSVAYTEGTTILRLFHSGAWVSYLDGGSQNLQQVTDIGSETTNSIVSLMGFVAFDDFSSPDNYSVLNPDYLELGTNSTGEQLFLIGNTIQFIKGGTAAGILQATNVTSPNNVTLEFPDKPTGSYTIATTSDIPSAVTNTSDLINDGEDGVNPFITALDIPTAGQAGTLVREVKNMTGATLTKGTVVFISGANGNKPLVTKALAVSDALSSRTFGLLQSNILNNGVGYCVVIGDLSGLDTSAFTEGAQLYLSGTVAGTFTETKTLAPTHLVYVGKVTRSHPTQGQIEVQIQNGYELNEIHDVAISSVANNQTLVYESATTLWKNKTLTASDVGAVATNSAITSATKTKITYDSKGLVTNGADATTADIADSINKRYVTDANLTVIGNTSNTNTGDETKSTILSKLGWFKTTVTTNYTVTGTTGETIASSTQLPTLSNGSIFKINTLRISKGALAGSTIRAYLSPNSNNLSGALQILSTGSTIVAGTRLATISRVFEIEGGNIKGLNSSTGVINDNGTSTVAGLDSALPAGTLYLIVTVVNALTTETTIQELLDISNF